MCFFYNILGFVYGNSQESQFSMKDNNKSAGKKRRWVLLFSVEQADWLTLGDLRVIITSTLRIIKSPRCGFIVCGTRGVVLVLCCGVFMIAMIPIVRV